MTFGDFWYRCTESLRLLRPRLARSSAVILVLANLIPLGCVLWGRWRIIDVLFLYWFETVIIGFFNVLKMLTFPRPVENGPREIDVQYGHSSTGFMTDMIKRIIFTAFLAFHYGAFLYCYGDIMIGCFTGPPRIDLVSYALQMLRGSMWIPSAAMFASHGFSFVRNYIIGRERYHVEFGQLVAGPYGRVIFIAVIFLLGALISLPFSIVAILFGKHASDFFGISALVALVLLKILLDLAFHNKEREQGAVGVFSVIRAFFSLGQAERQP